MLISGTICQRLMLISVEKNWNRLSQNDHFFGGGLSDSSFLFPPNQIVHLFALSVLIMPTKFWSPDSQDLLTISWIFSLLTHFPSSVIIVNTQQFTLSQPSMAAMCTYNVSILFALNSNDHSYSYAVSHAEVSFIICISFFHASYMLLLLLIFPFCQIYGNASIPKKLFIVQKRRTRCTIHSVSCKTLLLSPLHSVHSCSVSTPDTDVIIPPRLLITAVILRILCKTFLVLGGQESPITVPE